jgi:hypothetical protein
MRPATQYIMSIVVELFVELFGDDEATSRNSLCTVFACIGTSGLTAGNDAVSVFVVFACSRASGPTADKEVVSVGCGD